MIKIFLTGLLFIFSSSYSQSQYTQQWANRLNGTANSFDIANNMFLDEQSNVYVYSTVSNAESSTDISAVKYSPAGNLLWQYVYSSTGIDQLRDVFKDAQNFSYLLGFTLDFGKANTLLIKINSSGNLIWSSVPIIPGYENIFPRSITLDNSGNICVLLDGRNTTTGIIDYIIIKFNQNGTIITQKNIAGNNVGDNYGVKIVCDSQGNFFAGMNSIFSVTYYDIIIYKLDAGLNELYSKKINGEASSDDGIVDMKVASDNNLIFTAKITNSGNTSDIGTFKLNSSDGNILWQKFFNGTGNDIDLPYQITTDALNNVLVTGYARNSDTIGSEDIVTLKYSDAGNLLWSRIYNDSVNGTDQGYSVCTDTQNNVYIGAAADHGSGHLGYLTLKYDSDGNLMWKGSYHYYNLSEDFIYKIAVNAAQDIFVNGISFSNTTDYDVTTVKYAKQTGVNSNYESVNSFKLYQNYPNPFNPSTTIKFYNPKKDFITIKVFDISGKEIAVIENKFLNEGYYEYEFKADNLSSGVYFYKVFYGDKFDTGKMILSK